jgi:hypothetical protein
VKSLNASCASATAASKRGNHSTPPLDPEESRANELDPLDTSLSDGDRARLRELQVHHEAVNQFCEIEGCLSPH